MSVENIKRYRCDKCGKFEDYFSDKQPMHAHDYGPKDWYRLEAHPANTPNLVLVRTVCGGCFFFFWSEHFGEPPTWAKAV
jgi:hypothetical protein